MIAAFLAILGTALWFALPRQGDVKVVIDEKEPPTQQDGQDPQELRVIVKVGGELYADVPFGEERTIEITRELGKNVIKITADSVFMEEADCPDQQCVGFAPITRDNMETRTLRDMIICMPHQVTVQVTSNQ